MNRNGMNLRNAESFKAQFILVGFLFLSLAIGWAHAQETDKGLLLTTTLSGSSMDPAWIFKLDTSVGYKFNRYFEIDGGLPVYFIHVPADNIEGLSSQNGIGNAYLDLRLLFNRSAWNFSSEIRATAPTGDTNSGFSTGRATVDWTNYISINIGRWSPFGNVGIANTISDTHFFSRPFSSLGLVGHAEGGLTIDLASWISVGGSGYVVLPSGTQKIYSKLMNQQGNGNGNGAANSNGRGRNRNFETESLAVGESQIDRDRGVSGWVDLYPSSKVVFEIGYSRSLFYDSNSLFFSTRLDIGRMLRKKGK
jgi:hypothetical protein